MSDKLTIRPATPADLPALHRVIERAYRGDAARGGWTHEADLITEGSRTELATLEAILADPAQRLLVALDDNGPIGCVQVTDRGDRLAYLGLLAAAEDCARDVFGTARMEMTVIDSRVELIAYYARRGYASSGEKRDFVIPLDPPLFMDVLVKNL